MCARERKDILFIEPENCKECDYNSIPGDKGCYMFSAKSKDCRKHIKDWRSILK